MAESKSEELNAFTIVDEADEEVVGEETAPAIEGIGEKNEETGPASEDPEKQTPTNSKFVLDFHTPEADHPYLDLIESFEYPTEQVTITSIDPAKSISETPLQVIETRPELIKLLQTLRNVKEIAIDLLFDTRTYEKQIHLMALSTRTTDYIIDVLVLKNELLLLNEIFIDPKIVKILFFNSAITMIYLQQSLCLYIVNLVDLNKAAVALFRWNVPPCEVILQRNYPVDVKLLQKTPPIHKRPLNDSVLQFCRTRTHYLIHMYHDFKNRLLKKSEQRYKNVLQQCRDVSKVLHFDPQLAELQNLEQIMQNEHKTELEVLHKLFAWRTTVAKENDKNPNDVMERMSLLRFVSHLPTNFESVNLLTKSEYVRNDAKKITSIVKQVKAKYKPEYAEEAAVPPNPLHKHYEEFKKNLQLSNQTAKNKKAKLDKRPGKEKHGLRPRGPPSQRVLPSLNIQPFLNQINQNAISSLVNVIARNSLLSAQPTIANPPLQALLQNMVGNMGNLPQLPNRDYGNDRGGNFNQGLNRNDHNIGNASNFNQGSSRDYGDDSRMGNSSRTSDYNNDGDSLRVAGNFTQLPNRDMMRNISKNSGNFNPESIRDNGGSMTRNTGNFNQGSNRDYDYDDSVMGNFNRDGIASRDLSKSARLNRDYDKANSSRTTGNFNQRSNRDYDTGNSSRNTSSFNRDYDYDMEDVSENSRLNRDYNNDSSMMRTTGTFNQESNRDYDDGSASRGNSLRTGNFTQASNRGYGKDRNLSSNFTPGDYNNSDRYDYDNDGGDMGNLSKSSGNFTRDYDNDTNMMENSSKNTSFAQRDYINDSSMKGNSGNFNQRSNRDYDDSSMMHSSRITSNRGSNREYDLNILDREVNTIERRKNSHFPDRNNDSYDSRNLWRN